MMTARQILDARRELERIRRQVLTEKMAEYDKAHLAEVAALQRACERIGHHWQYIDRGPAGESWFDCPICGASKTEPAKP